MMRALWTAASGMIGQQTNLDTIANNLSNISTTGYKTQAANFKTLIYQNLQRVSTTTTGEPKPVGAQPVEGEALYSAVKKNGEVAARIIGDYLDSLHGVPLLTGAGAAATAPAATPKTIREAGSLALGYFRNQKQGG